MAQTINGFRGALDSELRHDSIKAIKLDAKICLRRYGALRTWPPLVRGHFVNRLLLLREPA